MKFVNTDKSSISHSANIWTYAGFRLFEQLEIMRSAVAARNCYDTSAAACDSNLRFQSMTLLLTGVILFLFVFSILYLPIVAFPVFFGRSTSRSVVSISTVSILSFVNNALFPDNLNSPDFISVFSIHTIIFQQFDSLTP